MPDPESVIITDVALRDGLQIQPQIVPTDVKVKLAGQLLRAGVSSMEVGSVVNPKLVPAMADSVEVYRNLSPSAAKLIILVPNLRGAEMAAAAGVTDLRMVISASEGHSRSNTNRSVSEGLAEAERVRRWCLSRSISASVAVATAFVCPYDGEVPVPQLMAAVEALVGFGYEHISLADTLGRANPHHVERVSAMVVDRFPGVEFGLHLHDTYGMGVANALAALGQGIRHFDSSLAGIGGCPFAPGAAGNVATEDLVFVLASVGVRTNIELDALAEGVELLASQLGRDAVESSVSRALRWLA